MTATAQPTETDPTGADEAAPRPRRDPRRRLRRPRHGHPAQAERRRGLRRLGARRRRRRHVVGEHLSRAASATSPRTSTRSRSRSTPTGRARTRTQPEIRGLPARVTERVRRPRPHPLRLRGHERELGRGARRLARARPSRATFTADVLVAAPGPLSEPSIPDLPGLDTLRGHRPSTRPAGTTTTTSPAGASRSSAPARRAIQAVPEIQPIVEHVDGLPAHAAVGRAPPRPPDHRRRARALHAASRRCSARSAPASTSAASCSCPGLAYRPQLMKPRPADGAPGTSRRQVPDPDLRARAHARLRDRLQADPAVATSWYPALTQPNVDLVTDGIAESAPTGSSPPTGELHEVDTIIFATGFHVTDIPIADRRPRPRRPRRWPRPGTAARRPTAARRSPASPTSSSSSGRTPASATTRSSS